tara:strand:+ start:794113 stop:794910 length:798 start_codon:yes stop_codon:yes gene_type:complete
MLKPSLPTNASELRLSVRRFMSIRSERVPVEHDPISFLAERGFECYIFGGAIRDIALQGAHAKPRDLDIVIRGGSVEKLNECLGDWVKRKTRFGGLKLVTQYEFFDIWPAAETWAFKEFPLYGSDPEDLPRTTPFNIEAIVVSTKASPGKGREVFEDGFFKSLATRTIDSNFEMHESAELTILRALVTAYKTEFLLSAGLVARLSILANFVDIDQIQNVSETHYGFEYFSDQQLDVVLKSLKLHQCWKPRSSFRMPIFKQMDFDY